MKDEKRVNTTEYAIATIDSNLEREFIGAAVMVASNYVQLRLGSLLADHYRKKYGKIWEELAELFRDGNWFNLLDTAKKLNLLDREEREKLGALFTTRNNAAHKTVLWKQPDEENEKERKLRSEAREHCENAKAFLHRTRHVEHEHDSQTSDDHGLASGKETQ